MKTPAATEVTTSALNSANSTGLVLVQSTKGPLVDSASTMATMSSREIAELTGKEHFHVKRDIRIMLSNLGASAEKRTYADNMNRPQFEFLLPSHLSAIVLKRYQGLARVPHRLQEEAALKTIEQLLRVKLTRQFRVLSYRIDGYDPVANIAYEIDEPEHKSKQAKDASRQQEIEAAIGCKFVRISL